MSNWPLSLFAGKTEAAGITSNTGTTVTSSGSANTKGSYAQLIASTTAAWEGFFLGIAASTSTANHYLVDIAIGGAGSEVVIAANIPVMGGGTNNLRGYVFIPVAIPAGVRVSARAQSAGTTQSIRIVAIGLLGSVSAGGMKGFSYAEGVGVATATSLPATITIDGSYYEIVASSARRYRALVPMFTHGGDTTRTTQQCNATLAVGAGGSEQDIITGLLFGSATGGLAPMDGMYHPPIFCDIPAGTRIAGKASATTTGDTLGFGLIGVA